MPCRVADRLQQYDYDCFIRISHKHRRHTQSTLETISRNLRQKNVSGSGITKANPVRPRKVKRRTTTGGVIGDVVFSPGSPTSSLPLLPVEEPPRYSTIEAAEIDQKEWTRDNWKQLDGCFTDERLEAGSRLGLEGHVLADVDQVQIENVVLRFLSLSDSPDASTLWTK